MLAFFFKPLKILELTGFLFFKFHHYVWHFYDFKMKDKVFVFSFLNRNWDICRNPAGFGADSALDSVFHFNRDQGTWTLASLSPFSPFPVQDCLLLPSLAAGYSFYKMFQCKLCAGKAVWNINGEGVPPLSKDPLKVWLALGGMNAVCLEMKQPLSFQLCTCCVPWWSWAVRCTFRDKIELSSVLCLACPELLKWEKAVSSPFVLTPSVEQQKHLHPSNHLPYLPLSISSCLMNLVTMYVLWNWIGNRTFFFVF